MEGGIVIMANNHSRCFVCHKLHRSCKCSIDQWRNKLMNVKPIMKDLEVEHGK